MNLSRPVYTRARLKRLFNPDSVAIVGASDRPGAFGAVTLSNLAGFDGNVYLVNAKYQELFGRPCYPSVAALPEPPDCVLIAAPREAVENILPDCVAAKAGGAVIFAAGYAETGKPERKAEQQRLTAFARQHNLPLVGPNCIGIAHVRRRMLGTFVNVEPIEHDHDARIGLVSQSGATGMGLLQGVRWGYAFSYVLTAGNSADVDVADEIAFLAEDPHTRVIACLFEGMAEPMRLLQAAELARANGKPVLIQKMGVGEEGAKAAMSHTGSLAGSHAAYLAAFERAGIIVIDNHEDLLEAAAFFAKAPPPKARGVMVFSMSGGLAILAADNAEKFGVELPQPGDEARAVLEAVIPDFGSTRNPSDTTPQVSTNLDVLTRSLTVLAADPAYGAVVMPQPQTWHTGVPRNKILGDILGAQGKAAAVVQSSGWPAGPGTLECEVNPQVALFRSTERCFFTLAAWQRFHDNQRAGERRYTRSAPPDAKQKAAALIAASKNKALTEREAKEVLAHYGVPVVREKLVASAMEACAAAQELGFPVALKVESPDLPHKTEAGVIRLNLKSSAEVEAAYNAVMANANKASPLPRINGVLVQPMVASGTEMMAGARIDPMFGPLIVAGVGGVMVELLKDTAVALAPVTKGEALAMLGKLRSQSALDGFRGAAPVDRDKFADIIARLSEFAADQADLIAELDVNPLICSGDGILAVDALIVKR